MSSAGAAPTTEQDGEEQETRECATCGAALTEHLWGDSDRRDYKCENGHGGHIAPDGTQQGPAFEGTGRRYVTDGGSVALEVSVNDPDGHDTEFAFGPSTAHTIGRLLREAATEEEGVEMHGSELEKALAVGRTIERVTAEETVTDGGTTTAAVDSTCQGENRHGSPCQRQSVPGARFCTLHIGDHVEAGDDVLRTDRRELSDLLTGEIVAESDSRQEFELLHGDDCHLKAVDGDEERHLTDLELFHGLVAGEYYLPRRPDARETLSMLVDSEDAHA